MSDIQGVMQFERLPNEIFFICFEYLNIFEIFYSFDQLTSRFSKLIRNILFQLNFENVRKIQFDQFCTKIKLNPEIGKQIYSLKLSNKDTCGQIEAFLAIFSGTEFSQLRSLSLFQVEKHDVPKLKSMLSLLSKLSSLHMIGQKCQDNDILDTLPMSNLRTLSIPSLHSIQTRMNDTSNIINLTIYSCSLEHLLYHLFNYCPMLKYLNVEFVFKYNHPLENDLVNNTSNGIHLKQLIIGLFKYNFRDFEMLVKLTPNLKSLTLHTQDNISMINAGRWKHLIQSSLPYLNNFQFKLGCIRRNKDHIIANLFKRFTTEFWCKQHQWYTEISIEKYLAFIYTRPYTSKYYKIELNTKRFSTNSNTFDKVTNVVFYDEVITKKYPYYFSNVQSLTLLSSEEKLIDISDLNMVVNLSNLKHLDISKSGKIISSDGLLKIFKYSSQISSMTIHPNDLPSLLNNEQLCEYLKKMITKLDIHIHAHPSFNNLDELKKFCEIFSNIEQLSCYVIQENEILLLLNQLSKLSTMNVSLPPLDDRDYFSALLEEELRRLNCIFRVYGIAVQAPEIFIWIGKNIN